MFSFKKTIEKNKDQYLKSLEEVLESGIGMLGPKVKKLENELCDYTGAKFWFITPLVFEVHVGASPHPLEPRDAI